MTYKPVNAQDRLRNEVLSDPESRAIYEATKLQIELSMLLKNARLKKKMTQEEVAALMHTQKPAISRLESNQADVRNFPSLLTIVKFASAIECELRLNLVPIKMGKSRSSRSPDKQIKFKTGKVKKTK